MKMGVVRINFITNIKSHGVKEESLLGKSIANKGLKEVDDGFLKLLSKTVQQNEPQEGDTKALKVDKHEKSKDGVLLTYINQIIKKSRSNKEALPETSLTEKSLEALTEKDIKLIKKVKSLLMDEVSGVAITKNETEFFKKIVSDAPIDIGVKKRVMETVEKVINFMDAMKKPKIEKNNDVVGLLENVTALKKSVYANKKDEESLQSIERFIRSDAINDDKKNELKQFLTSLVQEKPENKISFGFEKGDKKAVIGLINALKNENLKAADFKSVIKYIEKSEMADTELKDKWVNLLHSIKDAKEGIENNKKTTDPLTISQFKAELRLILKNVVDKTPPPKEEGQKVISDEKFKGELVELIKGIKDVSVENEHIKELRVNSTAENQLQKTNPKLVTDELKDNKKIQDMKLLLNILKDDKQGNKGEKNEEVKLSTNQKGVGFGEKIESKLNLSSDIKKVESVKVNHLEVKEKNDTKIAEVVDFPKQNKNETTVKEAKNAIKQEILKVSERTNEVNFVNSNKAKITVKVGDMQSPAELTIEKRNGVVYAKMAVEDVGLKGVAENNLFEAKEELKKKGIDLDIKVFVKDEDRERNEEEGKKRKEQTTLGENDNKREDNDEDSFLNKLNDWLGG